MLTKRLTGTLGAGIVALAVAASAAPAQAATFTVINTNNQGLGSLRSAINTAEQGPVSADKIKFEIPGNGVHTITPASTLPILTQPVEIKGYTQAGAAPATASDPAQLKIVIDAVNVGRGLDIGGDGIEVRGLDVQRAQGTGIYVEGEGNVIAGNHIGTGVAGTAARPNGEYGVEVVGSDNVIGGADPADRNVISSNLFAEVRVLAGSASQIEGNRIGPNAAGTAGLGAATGVLIESPGNDLRDNLISDESEAVNVSSDDNTLQGNNVGTNVDGGSALPNGYGITIAGGDRNLVGGTADGEGNVVSGNDFAGIQLAQGDDGPAEDNDVQGNLVGTTASGTAALPNGAVGAFPGVMIFASSDNTIGGAEPGAGNVIAANAADGIGITSEGADGNHIVGNWIGTDETGTLDLGNDESGVSIFGGDTNRVGDTFESTPMNTIAHNGDDGVTVASGTGNAVVRNAIHDNDELAIDLGANGATANDPLDADAGANDLQNGPEITGATATTVDWTLESEPGQRYRLEFYANDACDGSGSGEAQTYLGSIDTRTDANGNADVDGSTVTAIPAGAGRHVSMTATAVVLTGAFPNLVLAPRSTSELAPCEQAA
jgi:hypothetical protein